MRLVFFAFSSFLIFSSFVCVCVCVSGPLDGAAGKGKAGKKPAAGSKSTLAAPSRERKRKGTGDEFSSSMPASKRARRRHDGDDGGDGGAEA